MKQTIKSILAFAAVLLCGGAWATLLDNAGSRYVASNLDTAFTSISAQSVVINSLTVPTSADVPANTPIIIKSIGLAYSSVDNNANYLVLSDSGDSSKASTVKVFSRKTITVGGAQQSVAWVEYFYGNGLEATAGTSIPCYMRAANDGGATSNAETMMKVEPVSDSGVKAGTNGLIYEIKYMVKGAPNVYTGFVPSDAPAKIFQGITVADITTGGFKIGARVAGGWVNTNVRDSLATIDIADGYTTDEATYYYYIADKADGSTVNKGAKVTFTNGTGDNEGWLCAKTEQAGLVTLTDGRVSAIADGTISTSNVSDGYNVNKLQLINKKGEYVGEIVISSNADMTHNGLERFGNTVVENSVTQYGVSQGTLVIEEGSEFKTKYIRICNQGSGHSGDRAVINVDGTMTIAASSSYKHVYDHASDGGILSAHWQGMATWNVSSTGFINSPDAWFELNYKDTKTLLNINGGIVDVKGLYAYQNKSSVVTLTNGGLLKIAKYEDSADFSMTLGDGTLMNSSTTAWTFPKAIQFTDATNGTTLDGSLGGIKLSGAITGDGKAIVKGDVTIAGSLFATGNGYIEVPEGETLKLVLTAEQISSGTGTYKVRLNNSTLKFVDANGLLVDEITGTTDSDIVWMGSKALGYYDEKGVQPKHWYKFDGNYDSFGQTVITFDGGATKPATTGNAKYCVGTKRGDETTAFEYNASADMYYSAVKYGTGDWTAVAQIKLVSEYLSASTEYDIIGYGRRAGGSGSKNGVMILSKLINGIPSVKLRGWISGSGDPEDSDWVALPDAATKFMSYAVTYDSESHKFTLYVDGIEKDSVTMSAACVIEECVQIGGVYGGYGNRGGAILEDWRVYQSKLETTHLKAIADNLADDHYALNLTTGESGFFAVSTALANTITQDGGVSKLVVNNAAMEYILPVQKTKIVASALVYLPHTEKLGSVKNRCLFSVYYTNNDNAYRVNVLYTPEYKLQATHNSTGTTSSNHISDVITEGVHLVTMEASGSSGVKIYVDGVEVASDAGIHWSGAGGPVGKVRFGGLLNSNDWYAEGCSFYSAAVDTTGALPVAMINDETLKNSYASLAKALAAEGDHEITILKDIVETEAVTLTKDTTLNVLGSAVCGVACDITGNFAITKTGTGSLNLRGHRPAGAVILHEGTVKSQYGDLSISTDVTGKCVSKVLGDGLWTYSIADPVATVNGVAYASYADAIAAATSGGYSLTLVDSEVTAADIVIPAEQTLTIANAENLALNATAAFGGTGNVVLEFHTPESYASTSDLIAYMKAAPTTVTFKFFGESTSGFTLDFGKDANVVLHTHLVFDSGTHAMTYGYTGTNSDGNLFGKEATAENPTLWVKDGATLNFTAKDLSYWSGAASVEGVIRVDNRGVLNLTTTAQNDTLYFRQRFYLMPGSTTSFKYPSNKFCLHGGTAEATAQLYVPESETDTTSTPAILRKHKDGSSEFFMEGDQNTKGVAAFVGANSKLKIEASITNGQEFKKYGEGILEITGAIDTAMSVEAGTLAISNTSLTTFDATAIKLVGDAVLDLTGCTALTTVLVPVDGRDASAVLPTNIRLPSSVTDITRVFIETREEYANCSFKVANATDVTVKVRRPDGTLATTEVDEDGFAKMADFGTEIRITNWATAFDIVYENTSAFVHKDVSGATSQADTTITYNKEGTGHDVGALLKHHPYINNIGDAWFEATEALTLAVVGTMPTANRTSFIHMGDSNSGYTGLLIATGDKKDEVIIGWNENNASTKNKVVVHEITRMSVPNAASERHVYVVTKSDVGNKSTFTVYLDSKKWKTVAIDRITIKGGVQVGSDFGGKIHGLNPSDKNYFAAVATDDDSGLVNVIRVYDRVITKAEIDEYSKADQYPYYPPHGLSTREFAGETANWIESDDPAVAWSVTPKDGSATPANAPAEGSSLSTTLSAVNTAITVNVPADGIIYEELEVIGSGSATFEKDVNSGAISVSGTATLYRPITVKPGAIDLSKTPITLLEDGALTFDYSDYDVTTTYVTTKVNLTGEVTQNDSKITFTPPTNKPYHTVEMSYDTGLQQYVMTITPNHENGDRVYLKTTEILGDDNLAGKVYLEAEGSNATVKFPNDIVVLSVSDITLTADADALAVGKVLSGVEGLSVKKTDDANNTVVYSLINTSTEPIQPSEDPDPVVIEDVGEGVTLAPNANVEIALPEGATAAQKAEIAAKITVKYGETVLNPASGTKYVSVTIGDNGAVNVDTTTAAKPAVTEMTETSASEVSISFAPVPGLFYTLESGDTPDSFTPGDTEQATSSDTKTLQLSVPTGAAKVKFYRVSVKATK